MTTSGRSFLTLGILNLTPDSFSDGGQYDKPAHAIERALALLEDGADFVDAGAESTRPGASEISEDEEWERLRPFLELAEREGIIAKLSVDTRKFHIMKRAAAMKVSFINCVGPIPELQELRELSQIHDGLGFIATHMHGTPADMQRAPLAPASARKRVASYFDNANVDLQDAGFQPSRIFMDPGIGFGKTDAANLALLMDTPLFARDYNVAIGVSRKGFIGRLFGGESPVSRDASSKVIESACLAAGAALIRTHDVRGLKKISPALAEAIR